jgi:hypothetical protein
MSDKNGVVMELQRQPAPAMNRQAPSLVPILLAAVLAAALAAMGRYYLMENDALALQCTEGAGGILCVPWKWLPQVFLFDRLGLASLAAGAVGFVFRWRLLAWIGLMLGSGGIILYSYDFSAVGGLLALLTLACAGTNGFGQQQA